MNRKRWYLLGGLVAGICFLVGFLATSQIPRLRTWVLVKIENESRENLPVRILPFRSARRFVKSASFQKTS
ncbi:MAG: hypothetical protein EOP05_23780 [Proteobacteria bacterium]|nr:MAG: hypothetical protein EOP05_23780 [Pseudomonadota bacterium]